MSNSTLNVRYRDLLNRIERSSHNKGNVTFIVASKGRSVDQIEALYRLGHRDFGENYVQELCEKANETIMRGLTEIRWHFIGHLQTNKVKMLLPFVSVIHTVNSEKLAREIAKRWHLLRSREQDYSLISVFVEVNVNLEATKSGVKPSEVLPFISALNGIPELSVLGLMCIPSPKSDPRETFSFLRELEIKCRPTSQGGLSMGMSNDFEIAIEQGASHIRLGKAVFDQK